MKISKAETRILVRHFKELVEMDLNGITCSDARNTVTDWLREIGQPDVADDFSRMVYRYQDSPKIRKLEQEN